MEFVPTSLMNTTEKLNALSRFLLYAGALLVLIYSEIKMVYVSLVGLAIIYLIHEHYPYTKEGYEAQHDKKTIFQASTPQNPFMNVMLTDFANNPTRAPADDITDPNVGKVVDTNFAQGLYRDVDDIWDRSNSQRQFYTTPATTIPNDRESFMKWCWGTDQTCKDGNLSRCLKYEDVRAHGQI